MFLDELLERNRAWAQQQVVHDPHFFARQLVGQRPKVLWIGCSDSRVPAEQLLGCGPGDLFIHRNVANVVAYNDVNIAAVIQYAIDQLHIGDIIVCGHYQCGGVAAACAETKVHGYIGDWLMIIGWAKHWVDERLALEHRTVPGDLYWQLVVEENVRLQIQHLSRLSLVRKAWENTPGVPRLHGWVYDIATGLIRVLVDGRPQRKIPLSP
jgi:carbonic anhydrase